MNKNYEIKCRVENYREIKDLIVRFKKFSYSTEKQTDIYYKVNAGRLKLRIINNRSGSLIFYNRDEQSNKRISKYIISDTNCFSELDAILGKQFKVLVKVNKRREIYVYKNIRIHLDSIKELGKFLEVEIIYNNLASAKLQMKEVISKLKLSKAGFIKNSYSDLLIKKF
ncbi:MAG: class IV adenylate cyclase [Bacteroidota bacterium]|nr:class IV adenylate cyclase [Bacteroidota bacterium]